MNHRIRERFLKNRTGKGNRGKPNIQLNYKHRKSRQFAALLCVILTVMNLPGITEVLAKEADGRCEHHTVHTEECGYDAEAGVPCTYDCDICADGTGNDAAQPGTDGTPEEPGISGGDTGAADSGLTQGDASADTAAGNTEAPADADNMQDMDALSDGAAPYAAAKVITSWKWADENQIFTWNGRQWEGTLHIDVGKQISDVKNILTNTLPTQIKAVLEDGSQADVPIAWDYGTELGQDTDQTGGGSGSEWSRTIHPTAILGAGYKLSSGSSVRNMNVSLGLTAPRKFLSNWDYVARTGTTITSNANKTEWFMDVYAFGLTAEKVQEALKKVLPEEIYASGWSLQNGDANGQGGFRYDETSGGRWGWLKIDWLLDRLDGETFQDGQTFTVAAKYDKYWGVNGNDNGELIRSHLKMTINLHDLNLSGNIEKERVADPEATTVNLFDYWVEDYGKDPKEPQGDILGKSDWHIHEDDAGNLFSTAAAYSTKDDWNKGINKGHLLLFGDGLIHAGLWNKGAGERTRYGRKYAGMEGIVKPVLEDGYPVINTEDAKKTFTDYMLVKDWQLAGDHDDTAGQQYAGKDHQNLSNTVIGTWGKDIDKDKESLDYLFDPAVRHSYKTTYQNVTGLFQLDENGYYYYNMRQNFAEFRKKKKGDSDGNFVLYKAGATTRTDGQNSIGNFFPFNTGEEVFTGIDGNGKLTSAVECDRNTMNHHLGMTIDIDFRQPVDGQINKGVDGKQSMTFGFSGDDDVWVFIDDVLVLDLGGVHSEIYGTIDFATGDVCIGRAFDSNGIPEDPKNPANLVTQTTLKKLYENVGKDGEIDWNGSTFASNSDHKLRMFYLERGNYDSSIALRFNLQPRLYQQIKKVDNSGKPIAGVEFDLYAAEKIGNDDTASSFKAVGRPLTSMKTDKDGIALFTEKDEDGEIKPFNFSDRAAMGQFYYILRERAAPPGYRMLPTDIVMTYDRDMTLVLVVNLWETGAYASFTEKIEGNSHITYGKVDPAAGVIDEDTTMVDRAVQENGLVVAVPMLKQRKTGKWSALYGSNITGQHMVSPGSDVISWRKAVLNAMLHQCSDNSEGAIYWFMEWSSKDNRLEGNLTDLPGWADRYQLANANGDMKVVYAVVDPKVFEDLGISGDDAAGRYEALGEYTRTRIQNGESIEDVVDSIYDVDGALHRGFSFLNVDQFVRNFYSSVYIPNEQRELRVWKVDQDGKGVNGAVFGLFENRSCSGAPIATGTTATVDGRDGELVFAPYDSGQPGHAKMEWENSSNTRYYLKEIAAPAGHHINNTVTPIVVGVYSIYADAGADDDGVTVMAGVGKLAQTLKKFAEDETVDITLRDITAFAQGQQSGRFNLSGWNDMLLDGTPVVRSMNLHYGMNTTMHYGLHDIDGGKNLLPLFVTDSGFVRVRIQQNMSALQGGSYDSPSDINMEDLGNTDLTSLFSLLNIVVITDRTEADTRTGSLTISKMVRGDGLADEDYTHLYDFTVELTDASGQPLAGEYYFYGTDKSGYVRSGETIPLHHDEKVVILGLPEGTKYRVKETQANADWYVSPEDGEREGTILSGGAAVAAFINSDEELDMGTLTVLKMVTGMGNTQRKFTFTVTLLDEDGKELTGEYPYLGSVSGRFASGDKVELKHHESITITELPAGTRYKVTEEEANENGYVTSVEGETGTLVHDGEAWAVYTNYRETPEPPEQSGTDPKTTQTNGRKPASGRSRNVPGADGTGDRSQTFVWLIMLCSSLAVIAAEVYRWKGKRRRV